MGLGYGKHDGECSKAKEAHEAVPRRNFISCSLPQACEVCVHDEWKILTPTLQEDVNNHAANENVKEEDVESSRVIEFIASIQRRATTSSNSPPQEGDNDECSRYKFAPNQIAFDYDEYGKYSHKIWKRTCMFLLWFE